MARSSRGRRGPHGNSQPKHTQAEAPADVAVQDDDVEETTAAAPVATAVTAPPAPPESPAAAPPVETMVGMPREAAPAARR